MPPSAIVPVKLSVWILTAKLNGCPKFVWPETVFALKVPSPYPQIKLVGVKAIGAMPIKPWSFVTTATPASKAALPGRLTLQRYAPLSVWAAKALEAAKQAAQTNAFFNPFFM